MKLRETSQQNVLELNDLKTEKSTLLQKIKNLEDELIEAQLKLERITNNKLTQMLSVQKCSSDKTGLGYVASSSDISSTSKTVFVKPIVTEP
jgi:predicted  nucleic acid-binding Zn-ribbon protein